MPKMRTTVTLDGEVLRSVRIRAAQQGKADSEVIEEALRRELGLDVLDRLWAKSKMTETQAMKLAIEAQRYARSGRARRTRRSA